jgi:hypothetical protein
MLSPMQLSPMSTPDLPSPLSEIPDYEDDSGAPTLSLTEDSEPAVYIKIEPSSPISSAHPQQRIVSAGMKRDRSMLIGSLDMVPKLPKKRNRSRKS